MGMEDQDQDQEIIRDVRRPRSSVTSIGLLARSDIQSLMRWQAEKVEFGMRAGAYFSRLSRSQEQDSD